MSNRFLLGVDTAVTAVKAVVCIPSGALRAQASLPSQVVNTDTDWSVRSSENICKTVVRVITAGGAPQPDAGCNMVGGR